MDRPTFDGDIVVADGLPLQRLYARFDAIAQGRTFGSSSAAHQAAVIARLASNQKRAESLGWSEFVLERAGGTGRLELRGAPGPGQDRQLVPDAIPYDVPEPVTPSSDTSRAPRYLDGRFGNRLAMVSWRSRMRWLDDGGR
jgi:hypothetical protein